MGQVEAQAVSDAILAHAVGLVGSLDDRRDDLAGGEAFHELERVRDQIVGAQVFLKGPHGDVDGPRAEDDLASRLPAFRDDVQRAGIDGGLEHLVTEILGKLDQTVLGKPAVGAVEQLVERLAVHPVGERVERRHREPADQALGGPEDRSTVEDVVGVRVDDVGGDQRAVDVEEGTAIEALLRALTHGAGP